jgi:hypothetical protein
MRFPLIPPPERLPSCLWGIMLAEAIDALSLSLIRMDHSPLFLVSWAWGESHALYSQMVHMERYKKRYASMTKGSKTPPTAPFATT